MIILTLINDIDHLLILSAPGLMEESGNGSFNIAFATICTSEIRTSAHYPGKPKLPLVQKPTLNNLKLLFRISVQKPPELLFLSGLL
ncbi:MAG: hypothetical protein JWP94_769 [Mucilaginibacter sp.]|jgi:hypothetical protein|nr:hypothetical protein [Mucilaginibacter sp.]